MDSDSSDDELRRSMMASRRRERSSASIKPFRDTPIIADVGRLSAPTATNQFSKAGKELRSSHDSIANREKSPIVLSLSTPIASARDVKTNSIPKRGVPKQDLLDSSDVHLKQNTVGTGGYTGKAVVSSSNGIAVHNFNSNGLKKSSPNVPLLRLDRIRVDLENVKAPKPEQSHDRRKDFSFSLDSDSDEYHSKSKVMQTRSSNGCTGVYRFSDSDSDNDWPVRPKRETQASRTIKQSPGPPHTSDGREALPKRSSERLPARAAGDRFDTRPPTAVATVAPVSPIVPFKPHRSNFGPETPRSSFARQTRPGSRESAAGEDGVHSLEQQVSALSAEVESLKERLRQQQAAFEAFKRQTRLELSSLARASPAAGEDPQRAHGWPAKQ